MHDDASGGGVCVVMVLFGIAFVLVILLLLGFDGGKIGS